MKDAIEPSPYPTRTEVHHGTYRLSWWEPGVLAGIEIWPDPMEGPDHPAYSTLVLRFQRPGASAYLGEGVVGVVP